MNYSRNVPSTLGTRKFRPHVLKHKSSKPRLNCVPENWKDTSSSEFALFLLAYSNRLLFKTAIHIREAFQLPIYLNTIHIRYLLLLHYLPKVKPLSRKCPWVEIERADYPIRSNNSNKRIGYMSELVNCKLAIEHPAKSGTKPAYELSDMGKKAFSIIIEQLHEFYHTHPNPSGSRMSEIFEPTDSFVESYFNS